MGFRTILAVLGVAVAALVVLSWIFSSPREVGWLHIAGLGLSVVLLAAIMFGRAGGQPSRPPD